MSRYRGLAVMVLLLQGVPSWAHAQTDAYPNKPIRLLVPSPPGGSNDGVARVISASLNQSLGRPIVIDNRAGGGVIAPELVARWKGTFWPWLMKALTWSAVMMRGLETTLPLPSASSAEISRFRKRLEDAPKIDSAKLAGL